MLHKANRMEALINDQWAALGEVDKEHKIKLVIDEWGAWHPEGTEINRRHLFEQMGCLRDALVAALTLDTFHRHAEKVDMANIAQLVNNLHSLFLADEDKFVATPTFHVFELYRPHQGAEALHLDVETPAVAFRAGGKEESIFRLAGSASRSWERPLPDARALARHGAARGVDPRSRRERVGRAAYGDPSRCVERSQHVRAARGGRARRRRCPSPGHRGSHCARACLDQPDRLEARLTHSPERRMP
jgi:hypothetical protein